MTATAEPDATTQEKKSKLPLIIGLIMAIAGGGGGFFAVKMGLLGGTSHESDAHDVVDAGHSPEIAEVSFVALDPLVISLPADGGRTHLRFAAQLEVNPEFASEVESVKPRIVDVLNSYLRAVRIEELDNPTALTELRGQMLRRVQIVTGDRRVRDLLIMEFVLN